MKPINEKERTQKLLKFIGFFALAMIFLIVPVLFAKKVRSDEKAAYQKQIQTLMEKDKLANSLDSCFSMLLEYKATNDETKKAAANQLLVNLTTTATQDSTSNMKRFKTLSSALRIITEYQGLLKNYLEKKSKDMDASKCEDKIEKLQEKVDKYKEDLDRCRNGAI
jgi:hypothetical protein